jgi:hypothetical protein
MKRAILSVFVVLIISTFGVGYDPEESVCTGQESLDKLIRIVENEYPGFEEKTRDALLYDSFKTRLAEQAKTTPREDSLQLLRSYLNFFRDPHLFIREKHPVQQPGISRRSAKLDIEMSDFLKRIETPRDDLEGIWASAGYKVGIVKEGDRHIAFIIEADPAWWLPYEIKFVIHDAENMTFHARDHSEHASRYSLIEKAILHVESLNAAFVKETPKPEISPEALQTAMVKVEGFYAEPLSDKTAFVRIAGFGHDRIPRIQKVVDDNRSMLESRENLIIDVRNNPGGSSMAFLPLLPLISTNPMREMSAEFMATTTFLNLRKKNLEKYEGEELERQKRIVARMEDSLGGFFRMSDEPRDVSIRTVEAVSEKPRNVVILINKGCASATEQFVFLARQSKKVKLVGVGTYGALDYGNAMEFDFGCPEFILVMPTFRTLRLPDYPIDNIGIQPDIYLDASVTDWVEFARQYLEE